VVRILVLANSYPSAASPSGAPYLTNRLTRLAQRPGVEVRALALVPQYGPVTARVRRRVGLLPNEALRLADNEAGRRFDAVPCRWRPADVVAGRRGRVPMGLVARASAGVLAATGVHLAGPSSYDVVHAHGMYTLPAGAVAERVAAALEIPFVVSMHGSDVEQIMPRCSSAYREILSRAAATTYVSAALRERAVQLGAPERASHVIPNGVDPQVFVPHGTPEPAPGDAPRVLFVGNLLSVKGADRLPAIIRALRERLPGASLDVAGDGPLRELLAAQDPQILRLHGRVEPERVADLMRSASVLVVPSRAEGWGCVIGEAYATGTPVVGAAVGGIPEALGGFTAPIPEVGDEDALAEAYATRIAEVVAAPPEAAALVAHMQGRTWDAVVDAELAVLTAAAHTG
jgi:teichuronic acid biosynthesis glycosyltransferase TuaC